MKRIAIIIFLLIAVNAQAYQGARTGEEVDQGVGVGINVGATTGLIKSDGADGISAAVAGTDYVDPTSTAAITLTPAAGYDVNIVPLSDGDGLSIFDIGSNYSITLNVPDGTTQLKLTGSLYATDDLIFDTDSKISHASAGDFLTFKLTGGVPELYLNAPITNMGSIDMDDATDYLVGGSVWLDDTAGNGDTGNLWSADKIYDQLALKAPLTSASLVTPDIGVATGTSLTVSGAILGTCQYGADITTATDITAAGTRNYLYHFTAAAVATLPTAASAGYGACVGFRIRDAAEVAGIDVQAAEKIWLSDTTLAAGVKIQATGKGQTIVMCATTDTDGSGTDGWEAWGPSTGWASE